MNGEKLLVAVDWDEPIKPFKPGFFEFYNSVNGTELRYEDAPGFDMSEFMGFTSFAGDYMDFVDEYHLYEMEQRPELAVREEAVIAMRKLSDRFDFAVVTNRKCKFKPYTQAQMTLALPNQEVAAYHLEDFEVDYGVAKGPFVKSLGAVALIDDRVMNIESALEAGVHGLLFDDQFNADYEGQAVKVKNWLEIEDELSRLHKSLTS